MPAPSRGLSCNHTLLQALAMLSAAGLVDRVTRYVIETQPQNGLSLLVNSDDAFSHS